MRAAVRTGVLVVTLMLSTRAQAEAGALRYAWKKGDVHRYKYENATHFTALPGHAPINDIVTVRSVFAERVLAARPDAADVELEVEKFEVYLGKRSIGALDRLLPPEGQRLPARVDPKGRVALQRVVTAYLHQGQIYLGVRDLAAGASDSSTFAETQRPAGRERVALFASFNPGTGKLSSSPTPADRLAAMRLGPSTPFIDAVPRMLFDMLQFPDDAAHSSGPAHSRPGAGTWRLATLNGPLATIRVTSIGSRDDGQARTVLGAAPPAGGLADVTARFDTAAGALVDARGTVVLRTSMKISSKLLLTRL